MSEELKRAFGVVLKEHREKKGFSQETLASHAGISRNSVSSLENGTFWPTLETIFSLSEALDIPPHDLVKAVYNKLQHEIQ